MNTKNNYIQTLRTKTPGLKQGKHLFDRQTDSFVDGK